MLSLTASELMLLAHRVASVNAPDGDLDAEIDILINFPQHRCMTAAEATEYRNLIPPSRRALKGKVGIVIAASFTQSIDAAVTLVPPGPMWRWLLDRRFDGKRRSDGFRAEVTFSGLIEPTDAQFWCSHPAVALTASALAGRALAIERHLPVL